MCVDVDRVVLYRAARFVLSRQSWVREVSHGRVHRRLDVSLSWPRLLLIDGRRWRHDVVWSDEGEGSTRYDWLHANLVGCHDRYLLGLDGGLGLRKIEVLYRIDAPALAGIFLQARRPIAFYLVHHIFHL